jgi:Cd2+/Zn2+-exporting ATPase
LLLAAVLLGCGLLLGALHLLSPVLERSFHIAALLLGGWSLLPNTWAAVRALRPNINALMVLAVIGACSIGDWAEAATVVVLFGIAEWLEAWAGSRAHRAIESLLDLAPRRASVLRGGTLHEVPVEEVRPGERISVKSGSLIPLDGLVLAGDSSVNQAPITGEAIPVAKRVGDEVFAGTINGDGSLEVEVTRLSTDTTLARIIHLVREAQDQKAPTQRFIDRFARAYTPVVTVLALLVFLVPPLLLHGDWSAWLYKACVLLIISCPCALVISTPVSIVAGLTALARRGILVKGGAHLESLARLRALAIDKTGTLTAGEPALRKIEPLGATTELELLRIAMAIDIHSSHPLARALVEAGRQRGLIPGRAEGFREIKGLGAEGIVEDVPCFLGNPRFIQSRGASTPELERRLAALEGGGLSVIVVGRQLRPRDNAEALGILAVGDTLRPRAREALLALRGLGVSKIVILSGDNQGTVAALAAAVGVAEAHGDLLPQDKADAVRKLRESHGVIAMVGDGVNDAPAMATATLGIAMGGSGTDVAIETADIALMTDELGKVAEAVALARRTLGIIRFNVAFALGLKALFLALTLCGYASLWLAILADTGTTLLVVGNSLRLLRRPQG